MVDPSFDHSRAGRHGKDHTGNLLIQSEQEQINEGELLLHSRLHGEILEVGNILLEPVIGFSGLLLECRLSESEELVVGSYLGVEGVERGLKVCGEFVEGFLGVGDGSICYTQRPKGSRALLTPNGRCSRRDRIPFSSVDGWWVKYRTSKE